jgi:hypothetical protein
MNREPHLVESLFERQEIVTNVAGFFAPSHRELSEAMTVIGSMNAGGVAQHLDEIYRRQQYNRVDKPENAVKAVTKEYIANFRSAESIAKQLGVLALDISEIFNPNITLVDEISTLRVGQRALVRYLDLKKAYSDAQNTDLQKIVLDRAYFAKDDTVAGYILGRLGEIKVKDARKSITSSIEDQKNRGVFWYETAKILQAHRIAGPIVRTALNIK